MHVQYSIHVTAHTCTCTYACTILYRCNSVICLSGLCNVHGVGTYMYIVHVHVCECTAVEVYKYSSIQLFTTFQQILYMYMYICTYKCTCIYMYVRTNVYMCMHQHTHVYTCTCTCMYTCTIILFDLVFQICVSGLKGRRPRLPTTVCGLHSVCHAQTSTGRASPPTRSCTHTSVSTNSRRRMVSLSSRRFSNNSRVFPRPGPSFW